MTSLSSCSIPSLVGDRLLWDEKDFKDAFGDGKKCDFTLDAGNGLVLFEVVAHQITTATRINLSRDAFDADIEKSIMKKVRQLNAASECLLEGEAPLTGVRAGIQRPILPVVVVAMGFPYVEQVVSYIDELIGHEQLLIDARIAPLSILDFKELELVESQAGSGLDPATVLRRCQAETSRKISFWNWATTRNPPIHRSERVSQDSTQVWQEIISRLQFPGAESH